MSDQITFDPILPPTPMMLVDAKFLATLNQVESQVQTLAITDANSAQVAADLQVRLTSAGKKLDEARLAMKRPFADIQAKIDEVARAPKDRIELLKQKLRHHQIEWDTTQRRIAAEAEAARQRELARLEKLRREEEAEARRKTEELARIAAENAAKNRAPVSDIEFGDEPAPEPPQKTETEIAIERVKFAPAPVAEKPVGIAFRVSLRHSVENLHLLPDAFVKKTANDAEIRSVFCNGYRESEPLPTCPGVKFWVEKTPVSTGRATF